MTKTQEAIAIMAKEFANELRMSQNPFAYASLKKPFNRATKKGYSGFNRLYLAMKAAKKGYKNGQWLTFKQALALKGSVRKGEKSEQVFFWGTAWVFPGDVTIFDSATVEEACERAKKKGHSFAPAQLLRKTPFMKSFAVFNADQCDDIDPIDEIDVKGNFFTIVEIAPIIHGSGMARFDGEQIVLPEYYAIEEALLPIGEWASRFVSDGLPFAEKELVSALTGAFLGSACGFISPGVCHEVASQIADAIEKDPMVLYRSATKAEKASMQLMEAITAAA